MKHKGLKFLSLLLTLALLVGLMPGMSLTALAWEGDPYASLLNTTTVVDFDGKQWYLIENNSTAVDAGTVTLLAKECVAASSFGSNNTYSGSTVETAVNTYYNGSISSGVKSAVVDDKMFLLTTDQANAITNDDVRKCTQYSGTDLNRWWLCSPGWDAHAAACVNGDNGYVNSDWGYEVSGAVGVRPALKLNLSKVTFDSATKTFSLKPTGFTVTYAPGNGASLKDGIQPPQGYKVDGQNIVKTGVKGEYQIESLESCFNAPEGEHFDHWDDGKGHTYKYGATINPVTENITLTAIWVPDSKPDSGSGSGSGGGFDLVFNIPGEDNSWGYGGGYAPQQAYRVSLAPMQGGSAALGLTTGDSGTQMNVYPSTTVYVFPNAEPGYVLDKIVWSLIDGSASYDITEAKNFVMPAMDVVVYVTFKPVG